jgi:hypothetical protein
MADRDRAAPFVSWLALGACVSAVFAASLWALKPPPLIAGDVAPDRFSEARARELVRDLSDSIGHRVNGTAAHERAAESLAATLRQIPGLEVEIQRPAGVQVYRSVKLPAFVYRTINVVGRLPGRSSEALLLNAHFDTLVDSSGAADDGAGVAALVETIRVLAREAPLARTLVVNLNGGEEAGLFGAAGFLQHRWAKDVHAYLYLEAFPGGKAALLGAGPASPWLVESYARVAPAPLASVVGQELAQSGLLPNHGDFTPLHEAGLAGLDVAMTGDGWAYHTGLDRLERLDPAGLQHLGQTALAVTRALANAPVSAVPGTHARTMVYYDLVGAKMVAYGVGTSRVLALAALVLVAIALLMVRRRAVLSAGMMARALLWTALATAAGLLAAIGAGVLLGLVLGRPHGWFSAPALILPTFAAPALAATVGIHAWWRRRSLQRLGNIERHAAVTAAGGLLFWSAALIASAAGGVAAGYLALHWVLGGALGVLASLRFPRARLLCMLAGLLPGTIVTGELALLFLKYFVPTAGMLPTPVPLDFLIAALVGLTVVALAILALAVVAAGGGHSRVALGCVAVWLVGTAATAAHFPYSPDRPKRLVVAHAAHERDGREEGALLMMGLDAVGLDPVLASVGGFVPASKGWQSYEAWLPRFTHQRSAPLPSLPAPTMIMTADDYDRSTDRRTFSLRLAGPDAQLRLLIPVERLRGWSLSASIADGLVIDGQQIVHFEGLTAEGSEITLTFSGPGPVPLELRAIGRAPARSPEVQEVIARLPAWTTTTAVTLRTVRQSF